MDNPKHDLLVERYKYLLAQIQSLNENVHKYLATFQTLTTAIVGGGVALFVSWKSLNITAEVARTAMKSLNGILILLGFFVIFSICAGIFSWFAYRKEETTLLNEIYGKGFRESPSFKGWWRWNETYLILFIIAIEVFIALFVHNTLLPMIK